MCRIVRYIWEGNAKNVQAVSKVTPRGRGVRLENCGESDPQTSLRFTSTDDPVEGVELQVMKDSTDRGIGR